MIREIAQTIKCNHCGNLDFNLVCSSFDSKILQCTKCKGVRDISEVSEDAKHNSYHEFNIEPEDKPARYPFE